MVDKDHANRGPYCVARWQVRSCGITYAASDWTYDVGGRLSTSAYRNGVTTTYTDDALGRRISRTESSAMVVYG